MGTCIRNQGITNIPNQGRKGGNIIRNGVIINWRIIVAHALRTMYNHYR